MRHFAILCSLVLTFGWGTSSQCDAGSIWEYPAHSYYNWTPDWEYRVRIWYRIGMQDFEWAGGPFEYSGPTQVSSYYKWSRNFHQIDFDPAMPTRVWGIVENRYLGTGTWYQVDLIEYAEP